MTVRAEILDRRPELAFKYLVSPGKQWERQTSAFRPYVYTENLFCFCFFGLVGPLHQLPCHVFEKEITCHPCGKWTHLRMLICYTYYNIAHFAISVSTLKLPIVN